VNEGETSQADSTRSRILEAVQSFGLSRIAETPGFRPGVSHVPVSGRVLSPEDYVALVAASLDGWLTSGPYTEQFERGLAKFVGVRSAVMVNSGSSANLLAIAALTSPLLGRRRLVPGDEVITPALGFPTTISPIVQNGLRPVLIDIELGTYSLSVGELESAIGPRTRAIFAAHTLGNPFDIDAVKKLCEKHGLWLVEDACDALGSTYKGQSVGSFGDLATLSFYPAHHITTGEGGAVLYSSQRLQRPIESFRDWGRSCYCPPGVDNTCGRRFDWKFHTLPEGYDHKYVYSHIGYNLKATDIQASLGLSQLGRILDVGNRRRSNFERYMKHLKGRGEILLPEPTRSSEPSWFGFPIYLRPESGLARRDLIRLLEARNVGSRLLFAGNIARQPGYQNVEFRFASELRNSDLAMENALWIGVFPGLTDEMIDYVAGCIIDFLDGARS